MSVQMIEGFESADRSVWDIDQPAGTISVADTYGPATTASKYYYRPGASGSVARSLKSTDQAELYLAVRMVPNTATGNNLIRGVHPDGTRSFEIQLDATNHIQVFNNALTSIGTGGTPLQLLAWNLIEVRIRVGDATGSSGTWGIVEVRLNGLTTNELSLTNVDTKNGTNTTIGYFLFPDNTSVALGLDDIIVYDTTGSNWNSWVGDKSVAGFYPNAKGDVADWDPDGKTSVARWYFPDPAIYSATVDATPDTQWEVKGNASGVYDKGELALVKRSTALRAIGSGFTATSTQDVLMAQYVSMPVAGQTISGTAKLYMKASEVNAADDMRSQLVIWVMKPDGTSRGVLYAGDTGGLTSEWATTLTNRKFPPSVPITLSSVTATAGDRIVVELGARTGTITNRNAQLQVGDNQASDLGENETDTGSLNAWLEFSAAITLSAGDGNFEEVNDGVNPFTTASVTAQTDDDLSYVSTSTANDEDLYNLTPVPGAYSVSGPLKIITRVKKVEAGSRTLKQSYKTSGATQRSGAKGMTTSYSFLEYLLDTDATDAAVWSDSKLASFQIGQQAI
jgi:hypothetical protein